MSKVVKICLSNFFIYFFTFICFICKKCYNKFMEFILSQICGGIALILVCIGYFVKKKTKFLIFQIIANLFYAASFILLDTFSAGVITIVSTFRCILFYFFDKKNIPYKKTIYSIPAFAIIYITLGILFWKNWLDIIPIISATLFTIAFYVKNIKLVRYLSLPPNIILIVFSFVRLAYLNSVLDLVESIILIIAIIKFRKNDITKTES